MIKKFLAKLVGWGKQGGSETFHQQEAIERENAKERRQEAMEHERERLRIQMEKRKAPSEVEILGPSESKER